MFFLVFVFFIYIIIDKYIIFKTIVSFNISINIIDNSTDYAYYIKYTIYNTNK